MVFRKTRDTNCGRIGGECDWVATRVESLTLKNAIYVTNTSGKKSQRRLIKTIIIRVSAAGTPECLISGSSEVSLFLERVRPRHSTTQCETG